MGLAFGSINTGLPKDIVQQIMKAERMPIQSMENRKSKFSDKQKLIGELTSLVEGIRGHLSQNASARSFREFKFETRDDIVGVSVDKNVAQPGTYQIEIDSLAQKSSAMTSGFEDPEESYVGVGYITYDLPNGETKEIYIDSENSSLKKVARVINGNVDNGLRATVVNDGSGSDEPWRMILSLESTGDENKAEFPYFYFVDGEQDFFLEFEREAHDAKIKLDGFELEVPENKASDIIPGVTLDLKKAAPGEEFTLKIDEDVQKISDKVESLVSQINGVLSFLHTQNKMDENTDTSRTLGGDSILQSLESRFRSAAFETIDTSFGPRRLGDLGVTFQKDGLLKLDPAILEDKLNTNYKEVAEILTGRFDEDGLKVKGFMDKLNVKVGQMLRFPDGILPSRKQGMQSKIDQIDRRIENKNRALTQKEQNLKQKFARLESTISEIKSSGAGLAGMGNPVQQLG